MTKSLSLMLALAALAIVAFGQKQKEDAVWRSLVESERAFARTSVEKGMRDAFLAYLADDSIMFRPGPVDGKKIWRERQPPKGVLSWQPILADVARSGEMGYTTGPWEFREKSMADNPVAYGYFVSVWKKQADGSWKVALDIGTDNPAPTSPAPPARSPADASKPAKNGGAKTDAGGERAALLELDREFDKASTAQGFHDAFRAYAAEDVRLHRQNSFPAVGKAASLSALSAARGALNWQPLNAGVSRSGDLGYTYGSYELKGDASAGAAAATATNAASGHYLRIWKRQADGSWKVVLDLLNPTPPPRPASASAAS